MLINKLSLIALTALLLNATLAGASPPAAPGVAAAAPVKDGARAFDFFYGHWQVSNRRLLTPLQGSTQWEQFQATIDCVPILGGAGNQDVFLTPQRPGVVGMSLTLFDAKSERWSSYWLDSRNAVLQAPVVGTFTGNMAILEGNDEYAGRPIRVRNVWSRTDTPSPRWEQSFSTDDGKNWETNWIMDLTRAPASASAKKD